MVDVVTLATGKGAKYAHQQFQMVADKYPEIAETELHVEAFETWGARRYLIFSDTSTDVRKGRKTDAFAKALSLNASGDQLLLGRQMSNVA